MEACTGKYEEDTHFCFINTVLSAYNLNDNDVNAEDGIFKALRFQDTTAGTYTLLMDANDLTVSAKHVYGTNYF
eukprot:1294852-Ditylum_brightwellii.AAC.1